MTSTIIHELASLGNKIESKLKHSERRLKQAQAIAHIGSWELDLATGVAEWSEEACRIYGLEQDENYQTYETWLSFVHPDDQEHVRSLSKHGREKAENFHFNHRIIRKDGEVRYIFSKGQFDFDDNGVPTFIYGISHDVTEAKEAETERTRMIDEIVHRNKILEQFTYIVSHNLRAPVANIIGMTDLLQTSGLDENDKKEFIRELGNAAGKLDGIVLDLNDILQVDKKGCKRKEKVNFSDLIEDLKTGFGNMIRSEEVTIITDFSALEDMVTLKGYMYSILFNFISNSLKYKRPDVALVIEISTSVINNRIRILYRDNGSGIDMQRNANKVFGLYNRFHPHIDGKGMGLFMVKTQVELLGGNISLKSEVNKGTEFQIEIETDQLNIIHETKRAN